MITARIIKGENYYLSIKGHAGGQYGQDIVCAGVSAIMQNLIIGLENIDVEWTHFIDYGKIEVEVSSKWTEDLTKAIFLMDTTVKSLKEIYKSHPKKIMIMEKRSEEIV